jgi:peptidoglycan glycosyltransferase
VRKALPFASYGQGEVLASPLRMAMVAGTIAAGGVIPQPAWIGEQVASVPASAPAPVSAKAESKQAGVKQPESQSQQAAAKPQAPPKQVVRVLDKRLAASLAGAMRQVVTSGTGRSLSNAVMPVAGKTGTAQVDGAASHSWFVGFAPYDGDADAGSGTGKKIAFAVVLENAGYGARATPVVAEVVRAAKELGIAR